MSASSLSDWTEILLVTEEREELSYSLLSALLKGLKIAEAEQELEDAADAEHRDPSEAGPDPGEEDVPLPRRRDIRGTRDVKVELIFSEVARRRASAPQVYPFTEEDRKVVHVGACGEAAYLFLLVLGQEDLPYRSERRTHEVEAAYDLLCAVALEQYLGRNARSVRFARNSSDPDDDEARPELFSDAVVWLRKKLALTPGTDPPPDDGPVPHWEIPDALNSYSDAGVDAVVWWHFRDGRPGFPVLLAQCTVQISWGEKLSDINTDLWRQWINFRTNPPQRALVIPFAVDLRYPLWPNRTTEAGLILDRIRVIELLDEIGCDRLRELPDEATRQWVQTELRAA
ncbi:MAG: hypothetical protein QOJ29_1098 [Thermoleophilaceae bacterium]|jgi:hypothetical protein|nr:hypothetical protein [Thermoleophilaceae bacterium]